MEYARPLGSCLLVDRAGSGEAGAIFVAYLMRIGLNYRDAMTCVARGTPPQHCFHRSVVYATAT